MIDARTPNAQPSALRPLAFIVDVTDNAPQYLLPLAAALLPWPEVTVRTAAPLPGRPQVISTPPNVARDLLPLASAIARRCPVLARQRLVWRFLLFGGYINALRRIRHHVFRTGVPILHVQWAKMPRWDARLWMHLKHRGVRIVYTAHNALPHGDRRPATRRAFRPLYRLADAIVVLSSHVGRRIVEDVEPEAGPKIHVIEHGVIPLAAPMPSRADARRTLGLPPEAHVALFMGAIAPYKGIEDLLEAAAIARAQCPRLRVLIAGAAHEPWTKYQRLIDSLRIADLVLAWPEFVPESFKATLYAAADVAVLPHRDPSQSAMGLEAIGAGMPIIATRAGGLPDLVDEPANGFLVPPGSPRDLAAALVRFFDLPPARREQMGRTSAELGRSRFSWETIARKHIELYRCLATPTPQPAT